MRGGVEAGRLEAIALKESIGSLDSAAR